VGAPRSLYEGQLSAGALRSKEEEFGATLQVAMVHWRMRGKPEAAEPWFERVRKLEPAHPGMLSFFREWCSARGESAARHHVDRGAARDPRWARERTAIVARSHGWPKRARTRRRPSSSGARIFRQDPNNKDARDALKRLYRQTASWNALTDLLRQELESSRRTTAAGRLALLREIGGIYREHVKSDSALVTVLTQIVQLDPTICRACASSFGSTRRCSAGAIC
jgi:hypothetical protein